jgi:protein-tyrosine phosphatase
MAEALFERQLRARRIVGSVSSAGLLTAGRPAERHAVTVMSDFGLDISRHASQTLSAPMLAEADLVVGMERRHVREVAVLDRHAYARSFTLKELARRGAEVGPRAEDESVDEWLARVAADRKPADHLGSSPDDDVADPIGLTRRKFTACADEIDTLVDEVCGLLWPAVDRTTATTRRGP